MLGLQYPSYMSQSPHVRGAPFRVGELLSNPGNSPGKNPAQKLGAFYDHARELARLDSLLSGFFDPELATRFQVANLRQDVLILITPSASLATRLKLRVPEVLEFLHTTGNHRVHDIEIRVAPLQKPEPEPRQHRKTSNAAVEAAKLIDQLTRPQKTRSDDT